MKEYEVRVEITDEELKAISQEIQIDEETGDIFICTDSPEFDKLMERVYDEINSGRVYDV